MVSVLVVRDSTVSELANTRRDAPRAYALAPRGSCPPRPCGKV
jgi:hypothetical protein